MYEKITREFKRCRFRNCFISTYYNNTYDDTFYLKKTFEVPKKSILLYAFKDGERVEIKEDEKVFDTKRLVPELNPLFQKTEDFII